MGFRDMAEELVSSLLDFALVSASAVLDGASSVVFTVVGDVVGDESRDGDEELDEAELFTAAPLSFRPQAPSSAGQMEALVIRYGDDRVVIGTKDRRFQVDVAAGETVLTALGKDGTKQAVIRLKPNGDVVLDADRVFLADAGATEGVSRGTSLKSWLDAHTHGYEDDAAGPQLTSPPVSAYVTPPGVPDPSPGPSSKVFVAD